MKFVFLLLLVSFSGFTQTAIKKKILGSYSGEIPGYIIDGGERIIEVAPAAIFITLSVDGNYSQTIGIQTVSGTWKVFFEGDGYFVLEINIPGQELKERILLYKRGKKCSREGIFPQPNALLFKKR